MHIENEPLEIVTFGEQDYDEVVEEYEEEILVQEDVPEPPITDFANTAPAQGKPRCITHTFCSLNYICALSFKKLNETHLHIYIFILWFLLVWQDRVECYATGLR